MVSLSCCSTGEHRQVCLCNRRLSREMKWILPACLFAAAIARSQSLASPIALAKEICHDTQCYPAIFEPTHEFRVVHDDQSIPPGLYVKINLETGLKEARLLNDDEHNGEANANDLALVPVGDVIEPIPIAGKHKSAPFPPTKYLEGTERSNFQEALAVLHQESMCNTRVEQALDSLEDLAHELEFGLKIVRSEESGLERLLHFMQSSAASCRYRAALVLGSALQNNENAILSLPRSYSVPTQLLALLEEEHDKYTQKMLLYALSASMAQKSARGDFSNVDGHKIVLSIYESGNDDLKGKIASFIQDHFAALDTEEQDMTVQKDLAYEEQLSQLDALESWCNQFQTTLLEPKLSISARERHLSSVSQIKRANKDTCIASSMFLEYLAQESLGARSESSEALVAMARSARSLFGNMRASRKHEAAHL